MTVPMRMEKTTTATPVLIGRSRRPWNGEGFEKCFDIFSDMTSPRNSEPTSLTESMQLVDSILSDNKIDRLDKIDKLGKLVGNVLCQSGF